MEDELEDGQAVRLEVDRGQVARSMWAVARRIDISPHTVDTHLRHVYAKLGVANRVGLAAVVHHSIE